MNRKLVVCRLELELELELELPISHLERVIRKMEDLTFKSSGE